MKNDYGGIACNSPKLQTTSSVFNRMDKLWYNPSVLYSNENEWLQLHTTWRTLTNIILSKKK